MRQRVQEPPAAAKRSAALQASTRRSIRRIEKLMALAAGGEGLTTGWEEGFLADVEQRLKTYGRAFADPEKGSLDLATSVKQSFKIRQIAGSMKRKLKGE